MEYKLRFKRIEGNVLEKGYESVGEGLQVQRVGDKAPMDILFGEGVIIGKFAQGPDIDQVVPKGKTLEITFKD